MSHTIAAPSVTQDPTSRNPFCLLHVRFGPAPLSTWDGTELEWVLRCGNSRRACGEHGPSFGKVSELKGKWDLVWKMDKNSVGHQEEHRDTPAQPWTAEEFCSVPLCTAWRCLSRGTTTFCTCTLIFDSTDKNISKIYPSFCTRIRGTVALEGKFL